MHGRLWIVALSSLILGILVGGLAIYAVGRFTAPSPISTHIFDDMDVGAVLRKAKPAQAKFVFEPGGHAGRTFFGYDGSYSTTWEGQTDAAAVKETIFKALEAHIRAKGWEVQQGPADQVLGGEAHFAHWKLTYHAPDYRAGGWAEVFIHVEGTRVVVVLTFNTGYGLPE
jgi:hypothetical protein